MPENVPYTEHERIVGQLLMPGREKAISIRELKTHTGLSEREIKQAVADLRLRHRLRVGANRGKPCGYYLIATPQEEEDTFHQLVQQAVKMLRAARAIRDPRSAVVARRARPAQFRRRIGTTDGHRSTRIGGDRRCTLMNADRKEPRLDT